MSTVTPPSPLPPDSNLGPALVALTVVLTVLSLITTGLRWYVRVSRRVLGWDDFTIAAACVLSIARMAVQIASVHYGNGRHRWFISPEQYQEVNMYGWIAQVCLFPINCLEKISICLVVLRIKSTPTLRSVLYAVMAGLVLFNGLPLIILLAECSPVQTYWNFSAGHCWNPKIRTYVIYTTIAYGILTDIICTSLPPIAVWKLQMPMRQKVLVCGLVGLGLLATACSIGRATSLGLGVTDLSWSYCIAAFWSNAEAHIGIIASNLTVGPALFKSLRGRRNSSTTQGYMSERNGTLNSFDATCRRGTSLQSDTSEYGSQQGIRREMDVYVTEETRSQYGHGLSMEEIETHAKSLS